MDKEQFKKYEGFLITRNKISILSQVKSLTKKDTFLTEKQQISFFEAVQKYLDSVQNRTSTYDKDKIEISEYEEQQDAEDVFYKYVTKQSLENYIKKGIFKLGTLNHYQKAKNNKIKDEKEGYTHLIIESEEKQLLQSFCSGFNYLIFCGSYIPPSDTRSKHLIDNFGPCVLKIKNISSFKREIEKHLNIRHSIYNRIEYNEMKILRYFADKGFTDTTSQIIDHKTFSLITKIISPNTVFRKTFDYSPEFELRFAFETSKDQKHPVILNNKGLLKHIEIIKDK